MLDAVERKFFFIVLHSCQASKNCEIGRGTQVDLVKGGWRCDRATETWPNRIFYVLGCFTVIYLPVGIR